MNLLVFVLLWNTSKIVCSHIDVAVRILLNVWSGHHNSCMPPAKKNDQETPGLTKLIEFLLSLQKCSFNWFSFKLHFGSIALSRNSDMLRFRQENIFPKKIFVSTYLTRANIFPSLMWGLRLDSKLSTGNWSSKNRPFTQSSVKSGSNKMHCNEEVPLITYLS